MLAIFARVPACVALAVTLSSPDVLAVEVKSLADVIVAKAPVVKVSRPPLKRSNEPLVRLEAV